VIKFHLVLFMLAAALALPPGAACAHDYRVGALKVEHPWAIATPKGAKVGAGYMKITNEGTQPDRLIALSSPAARRVVVHIMTMENGVARMRPLDKGLEIKPGETVELKPEGTHVMFEGLRAPFLEASRVQGTLVFEKAGSIDVDYAIEPMGTKAAPPPAGSHTH
jgi:copper(I)-binding protein